MTMTMTMTNEHRSNSSGIVSRETDPGTASCAPQNLAEAQVHTPSGDTYLVRVARNGPVVGVADAVTSGNPITGAASLAKANLANLLGDDDTGWTITVLKPNTPWRAERPLYRQHVGAQAIVVDVTLAITNALARGDTLWR